MFGIGIPEILLLLIVFGFIALLIAGIKFIARLISQQNAGVKVCPYCAERIQAAAIVCRFCKRDLTGLNAPRG